MVVRKLKKNTKYTCDTGQTRNKLLPRDNSVVPLAVRRRPLLARSAFETCPQPMSRGDRSVVEASEKSRSGALAAWPLHYVLSTGTLYWTLSHNNDAVNRDNVARTTILRWKGCKILLDFCNWRVDLPQLCSCKTRAGYPALVTPDRVSSARVVNCA